MKLLFTKNKTIASRIIQFVTGESVSHCGFLIEGIETVLHANFFGTNPQHIKSFDEKNEVVFILDVPLSLERELHIYKEFLRQNSGRWYDFGGILYYGVRLLLNKFFSIPVPEQNLWADKNFDFCVEALCRVSPELTGVEQSGEMLTPYGFYLLAKKHCKEIPV